MVMMKGIFIVLLVLLLGNVILLYLLAHKKGNPGKFDPGVSGGDRSRLWD